jgi:hypothetical protein
MRLMDLLRLLDSDLDARDAKIHLASHNGREDPLDQYRAGTFDRWQSWQSRQNFERQFVISLIQMPVVHTWLFAGAYSSYGCDPDGDGFVYRLEARQSCLDVAGRAVVHFERPSRQSYLNADRWIDSINVHEIRPERLILPDFPGFKALHLSKAQLDMIVKQDQGSWRAALSSVAGIYLIADKETGRFYVGSAVGEGGIWQRWLQYSTTAHGGNKELKELLGNDDRMKRAGALQFSVLEIADTHASEAEILERESHWKRVLLTRIHGLNAN